MRKRLFLAPFAPYFFLCFLAFFFLAFFLASCIGGHLLLGLLLELLGEFRGLLFLLARLGLLLPLMLHLLHDSLEIVECLLGARRFFVLLLLDLLLQGLYGVLLGLLRRLLVDLLGGLLDGLLELLGSLLHLLGGLLLRPLHVHVAEELPERALRLLVPALAREHLLFVE